MAYLRKEHKKYGTYISIVEAYRDEHGKAQQRRIANLGNINNFSKASLKNIARSLYELAGGDLDDLRDPSLEEIARYNYGFHLIYKKLLKTYGLDILLKRLERKHKLSYSLIDVLMLMIIERVNEPSSKRSNFFNQAEYLGIKTEIKLEYLYRSLNLLDSHSDLIQKQIYQKGRDLFNLELDVVFYDVTTLYFESNRERIDSLPQKGYGKDGKVGDTQIVFSILIDKHQQPVGYQIHPGNKYEGHTLSEALERLREKYQIDKVIVVADRGMLSKNNLDQITSKGYEYIVGERLKKLPQLIRDYLIDHSNYQPFDTQPTDDNPGMQYCQIEYNDRTIIATYSEKRARKDQYERAEKIEKAKQLLKNPSRLNSKMTRHYLKRSDKAKNHYQLDEDKIEKDKKYDGILAISTSSKLGPQQILDQYKQLFKIEKTFRTFKHHLELRPIFHWTDSRIRGHICMAYITYTLLNSLQLNLAQSDIKSTENQLRNTIGKMQLSLVKVNDTDLYMRSAHQSLANQILKTLKIKPLPNYIHPEALPSYL